MHAACWTHLRTYREPPMALGMHLLACRPVDPGLLYEHRFSPLHTLMVDSGACGGLPHAPLALSTPPAYRRAACRTLSWHESRSRAWQVALTEPDIAHNKQNNDNDTDDSEDVHAPLLVRWGTRTRRPPPGESRSPSHGLACAVLVP